MSAQRNNTSAEDAEPHPRRVVEELRQRFALDTAGGLILGLGVDALSCTVSVLLPGGPTDPDRSSSTEDRVDVGDVILSVGGVCMCVCEFCACACARAHTNTHKHTQTHTNTGETATPDNINDLLRGSSATDAQPVAIIVRKKSDQSESVLELTPRTAESRLAESFQVLDTRKETPGASFGNAGGGEQQKEVKVTFEKGAAGTMMRFTSLVQMLKEAMNETNDETLRNRISGKLNPKPQTQTLTPKP